MLANVVQARYPHLRVGADDGCFASALASVRRWGGVLEHPAESMAWRAFGIARPIRGRWLASAGGWTAEVAQSTYGHRARKRTWLFCSGREPPLLRWDQPRGEVWVSWLAKETRRSGTIKRMTRREARATPALFRDLLISIALHCLPRPESLSAPSNGEMCADVV